MYRNALQNIEKLLGHGGMSPEPVKTNSLVRPPQLDAPRYDPNEFVNSAVQNINEASQANRQARASDSSSPVPKSKAEAFLEGFGEGLSREEYPDLIEETTDEGVQVTTNAARYGLVTRPNPKSGGGFLGLIDQHEGGGEYGTLLGFSNRSEFADVDITNMTLAELDEFAKTRYASWSKDWKRKKGHGDARVASTPMGRYQFVNTTLQAQARKLGLDPTSTKFDAATQDMLFDSYLKDRLSRADTIEGKRKQLREAWEGFKGVNNARLDAAIREYESL
jgi:hypothetical protein